MLKNNRKFLIIATVLISVLLLASGCGGDKDQGGTGVQATRNDLVFGSSVDGSYGYLVLEAMSSVLSKHLDGIRVSAISTNGGTENIVLLFNNEIDAGHSNSTDIPVAYRGEAPFREAYEPVQLVSYGALTQIIAVHANSDINSIYDLAGKRVVVGPVGSGLESIMSQYFELAGVDIVPVNLGIPETADAFLGGRADAVALLFRNGEPYPVNMEVEAGADIRYLEWDSAINQQMIDAGGAYTINYVDPGVSKFMNQPMEVLDTPMILVVRPDMPEDLAYNMTKILVENVDELVRITPHLRMLGPEHVTNGLISNAPVHPGAARYYKEAGIWEDRLTEGN